MKILVIEDDQETADYVGIGVHCAQGAAFCADATAVKFGQTTPSKTAVSDLLPDWVFWGVAFPWGLCLLLSVWFCFRYMADDDLGQDREGPGHE